MPLRRCVRGMDGPGGWELFGLVLRESGEDPTTGRRQLCPHPGSFTMTLSCFLGLCSRLLVVYKKQLSFVGLFFLKKNFPDLGILHQFPVDRSNFSPLMNPRTPSVARNP